MLARHLPAGAALWQAMGADGAWTQGEHIAALIFDATQVATWQRGGGNGPRPNPLPRPGEKSRTNSKAAFAAAKAAQFAARHREG